MPAVHEVVVIDTPKPTKPAPPPKDKETDTPMKGPSGIPRKTTRSQGDKQQQTPSTSTQNESSKVHNRKTYDDRQASTSNDATDDKHAGQPQEAEKKTKRGRPASIGRLLRSELYICINIPMATHISDLER